MRHDNDMISENRESEKDWKSAVRRILADPGFARNVRGRLISATRLLPARLHPELACDYAGHVVRICENASGGNRCFRNMIARIREFLRGGSAEKVISARSDLFDLHYHLKRHSDVKKRIASEASWTIAIAVNVCCQRELETLGVIVRSRRQPSAVDVAGQACYAAARRAGGENWNSDSPELRADARRRGREASDTEAEWQVGRLRALVEPTESECPVKMFPFTAPAGFANPAGTVPGSPALTDQQAS